MDFQNENFGGSLQENILMNLWHKQTYKCTSVENHISENSPQIRNKVRLNVKILCIKGLRGREDSSYLFVFLCTVVCLYVYVNVFE